MQKGPIWYMQRGTLESKRLHIEASLSRAYQQGHKEAALTFARWYENRSFFPDADDRAEAQKWREIAAKAEKGGH